MGDVNHIKQRKKSFGLGVKFIFRKFFSKAEKKKFLLGSQTKIHNK